MATRLATLFHRETQTTCFARVAPDGNYTVIESFSNPMPMNETVLQPHQVQLIPPLPHPPSKIIAVGLNYPAHIDEMKHQHVPTDPVLFLKAPSSLQSPFAPIEACPEWGRVDYEGELAVVIGTPCKTVPEAHALDYVLGYTLANDVTARTLQRQDTQWGRAKNFDTFCPLGPYMLLNEGQDPAHFQLQTMVDDQVVQEAAVSQMRFSVPFLIAYISSIMTLFPGDIILTGTPQGVGPLQPGQTIKVGIPQIGWLENTFQHRPQHTPALQQTAPANLHG